MNWFADQSALINFVIWFGLMVSTSLVVRFAVRRWTSPETLDEHADVAGKMVSACGAAFAFLVGFGIATTWGAIDAGQSAVEQEAAAVQLTVSATRTGVDRPAADEIKELLADYLTIVVNEDPAALDDGEHFTLPSDPALNTLIDRAHEIAYNDPGAIKGGPSLVAAVESIDKAQGTITGIADRSMPPLIALLLVIAAMLLAGILGVSGASRNAPMLLVAWALVPAVALTVVFSLDHAFAGAVAVDLHPLQAALQDLTAHP